MGFVANNVMNFMFGSVRRICRLAARLVRGKGKKFQSADYWEARYRDGGTSGSGSYGRLAKWKAQVLNDFVSKHAITRVLELGSGDGNQLSLANYSGYVGFDVSEMAVTQCRKRFADRDWSFNVYSPENVHRLGMSYDPKLVMSLDVIFHLIEDQVFDDYMRSLFSMNPEYVVIYSSNGNFSVQNVHVRNWTFTDWIAQNVPEWILIEKIENPYPWDAANQDETSFADFYIFRKSDLNPSDRPTT
jgi:hypothetical protein